MGKSKIQNTTWSKSSSAALKKGRRTSECAQDRRTGANSPSKHHVHSNYSVPAETLIHLIYNIFLLEDY
ncbi:hypothetical protein ACQP3C_30750, partial [Escherichia coli]